MDRNRYVNWWTIERNKKGVYEYDENGDYKKTLKGGAIFHQFGVSYEEFESGPGNYSTAIIELQDGTIKNVPVENIAFK